MKKVLSTVTLLVFGFTLNGFAAEELRFPKTESEFVEALSADGLKQPQSNTRSLTREMDSRGVGGITAPSTPLKAGALVTFDYDSAQIKPDSFELLDSFGSALNGGLVDADIVVSGHTDSSGTETYNQRLSIRRAQAVVDYLIYRHHVADSRLVVQGLGESSPIADNQTSKGRSMNRRVEFIRQQ